MSWSSSWVRSTAKAGDQEVAAGPERGGDLLAQQLATRLDAQVLALAVAVGAFDNEVVEPARRLRPVVEGLLLRADVAGEQQAQQRFAAPGAGDLELDRSGAEDMAGVPEARPDPRRGREPLVERPSDDAAHRALGVGLAVDRLDRAPAAPPVALVEPGDLALLDVAAVGQHEAQQVARRLGRQDRAAEALAHQLGQQAAVVDVGVGQHHEVERRRIEGEVAVVELPQGLVALEQAAIDQEGDAVAHQSVAGARDHPRRAVEAQLHRAGFRHRRFPFCPLDPAATLEQKRPPRHDLAQGRPP